MFVAPYGRFKHHQREQTDDINRFNIKNKTKDNVMDSYEVIKRLRANAVTKDKKICKEIKNSPK